MQLPPLPPNLLGGDPNKPLDHYAATQFLGSFAAILNAFFNDPRVQAAINAHIETRPDGFTFTADLKPPPQVEPDAIKAIGT